MQTQPYILTGLNTIAAQFNRSPDTIRRWIINEHFPAPRVGREFMTTLGLIDRWLAERHATATAERERG